MSALQSGEVLSHVAQTVEAAAYAAEVAQRRQKSVEPQAAAEAPVLHIGLTQLGVSFAIRRQSDVLSESARLLHQMHVRHDF